MSYSQYDEERAILDVFRVGGKADLICGRFLDIGAYHPKVFSNTRALYEAGWSGVMFEPGPRQMLDLIAEYGNEPRITLVAAAVGLEAGELNYQGTITVPVLTLERIFLRWGSFDFINLDAEGVSADLFMELMKSEARPRCICVEHDNRLTELADTATRKGYRVTLVNGTNAVFVR